MGITHSRELTVNAQEQGEIRVMTLGPLGDDAADSLQILKATSQLLEQLRHQLGCVC